MAPYSSSTLNFVFNNKMTIKAVDTLLALNPVCSVKGELEGLTAMQPHLGKSVQLTAQLKERAGVLIEDAIS